MRKRSLASKVAAIAATIRHPSPRRERATRAQTWLNDTIHIQLNSDTPFQSLRPKEALAGIAYHGLFLFFRHAGEATFVGAAVWVILKSIDCASLPEEK